MTLANLAEHRRPTTCGLLKLVVEKRAGRY
jgi:hypothetical protein